MTAGAADERPPEPDAPQPAATAPWRTWCLIGAALLAVVTLLPPLGTVARRTEWVEALQFGLLAVALPALVTLGAPWRLLGLSAGDASRPADRVAEGRRRHPELIRSIGFMALDLAVVVAWRTPGAVHVAAAHGWATAIEAVTLLVAGVALWLELVLSPPFAPRAGHFRRAVFGAVVMWVFWILAYIVAMSTHDFYANFHHTAGGLSAAADQQIAAAVSWFVAAVSFLPVVFWNAVMWLQTEEDPDTELASLLRAERRRGSPPGHDEGTRTA